MSAVRSAPLASSIAVNHVKNSKFDKRFAKTSAIKLIHFGSEKNPFPGGGGEANVGSLMDSTRMGVDKVSVRTERTTSMKERPTTTSQEVRNRSGQKFGRFDG